MRSRKVSRWIDGNARDLVLRRADAESGVHLLGHALGKVRGRNLVDRDNNYAAQQASEERHHPLGAVLAPEENLVTLGDFSRVQLARKTLGVSQHLAIGPALHSIAAVMDVGNFERVALKVVEILQDGGACHLQPV